MNYFFFFLLLSAVSCVEESKSALQSVLLEKSNEECDAALREVFDEVKVAATSRANSTDTNEDGKEPPTCAICFDDIDEKVKAIELACSHVYCVNCLREWFLTQRGEKTCPQCRAPATESEVGELNIQQPNAAAPRVEGTWENFRAYLAEPETKQCACAICCICSTAGIILLKVYGC